jgi:TP901 family phage tail tape measure protein
MAINLPIVTKFDAKGIKSAEDSLKKFGRAAGTAAAAATAAVAGIATASVREFGKFDSALNKSISIMGDVSDTLQDDMAKTAREVAKSTTFSAEEAAEAYFFLASAGLDAEQQIAAMPQVAKFAQAGMFDMARATDLATDAQSALGLASDDTEENLENLTRVTDVFVKANTLANTSVEQLASAMTTKAGNALKTVGKDIEEGSAALAVFADQGIKGERAGTLLTNTLFGLTENAQKNAGAFESLGIEVFDADGAMRNMADIADDVTNAFDGMSEEQKLAEISALGFTKQTREGVLALAGNGEALREYESALNSAGGTAEEVANNQLQTMEAQFQLLQSEIADVGIEIGSELAPVLLELFEQLKPIIDEAAPAFIEFFTNLAPVIANAVTFFVEQFIPAMQNVFKAISDNREIIGFFIVTLGTLLISTQAIITAVKTFTAVQAILHAVLAANPIGIIITALAVFAAGVIYLATQTTFFQDAWTTMTEIASEAFRIFGEIFTAIGEGLVSFFTGIVENISESWSKMTDAIGRAIETAAGFIKGIWDGLVEGVNTGIENIGQFFEDIWNGVTEFFRGVVNGYISIFESFFNFVIGGANGLIRALNRIRISIPSTPFTEGFSIGVNLPLLNKLSIPRLAEGGIVMPTPGGILANIGEGGQPEAVIPLDRMGSMGNTTNNINITVNAGTGTDPVSVGRAVVDAIKRYESTNGKVFAAA